MADLLSTVLTFPTLRQFYLPQDTHKNETALVFSSKQ